MLYILMDEMLLIVCWNAKDHQGFYRAMLAQSAVMRQ